MKKLKSLLVTLAMLLCTISASAHDFYMYGIYYNITDSEKLTVEVTYRGSSSNSSYSGDVVIPETVTYASKTYAVTSIGDEAFLSCSLTSVTIPNSVTSIGDEAFCYCSSLTSVTIPNSVTSIGSSAFYGTAWYNNQPDGLVYAGKVAYKYKGTMPSNTSIELAEGTLGITGYAFYGCSNLTSITIPDGVTSIGNYAFYNCSILTSITIPNGVISIGDHTFCGCSSLTSVTIPNSVTSIGEYAFDGCSSLTSVHILDIAAWCNIKFDSYTSNPLCYAEHLYMNGKEITELKIPDGVTSIGNYAFSDCRSLTSITIPDGVTRIGDYTFYYCRSLTSVTIPDGVTSIGDDAFRGCSSLTSVTIPENITQIEEGTFYGCSKLKTVTLPKKLYMIKKQAFQSCSSLKSITIPDSVGYIYQEAFANCKGLESVKVLAETPPFAYDNTFSNYEIELCVPEKSVEAYQKTNPWSKFKTFKNLTGDDFEVKVCATPTIAYVNGELVFDCETEGVEYVSEITDADIKKHYDNKVKLTATYNISVYATKEGYKDSEVAKATLCWIDVEPKSEGLTDTDIANVKALPVVVQASNGTITVTGANDGTMVEVYGISGAKLGEAKTTLNSATIHTDAQTGSVVIVKVGNKSIKIRI
ncbi:MAG: leucine-rich repeat domain-containing protein [Prevotella sp.]|nr:leucine-rich repeat domain-containing protein [Prevotella sp.]